MKRILAILLLAALSVGGYAQQRDFPQRNELVVLESDNETLEIFKDKDHQYFLSVGHLGVGDEVVQVYFDPVFELFIPLGSNVSEALETLQQLQALSKDTPGTSIEMPGCLALGFPTEEREPVRITCRKAFLCRHLLFSVEREGYVRATTVTKSNIGSLVTSLKLHKKFHPND